VGNEKKSVYLTKDEAISLSQGLLNQGESLPNFLVTYISLVKTHSYENAPIRQEGNPYPVLLFNHGYNAWSTGYTIFHEALASHGYVVVGVTHAYECAWFSMPDGTMKVFPQTAEVVRHNADAFIKGEQIKWQITISSDIEKMEESYRALQENSPNLYESVNIWAQDNSFIIDQLELLNQEGALFSEALDLDRIGVYGHSFGGATAGQLSLTDPRIKAGVNLDGFQYGDMVNRPLGTPFMFINAEHASENRPDPDTTGVFKPFYARAENDVFILFIEGTEHNNFTDMVLNGKQLPTGENSITPLRGLRITNDFLLAFFGEYLKDESSLLLGAPVPDYPEVVLHARRP
jgi:pimeloyl-ACP methyl ester carboxylesterase